MKKIFLSFIFLFFASTLFAVDYYVSATGSNSNNGLSIGAAWQTLSKVQSVCNAGTIHAGDRILFKCGDTFSGSISIDNTRGHSAVDGTALQPVTWSYYGTGAKPIFLCNNASSNPEDRHLLEFIGMDYWIIDGIHFTDTDHSNDHIVPGICGFPIYLGSYNSGPSNPEKCNHWLIQYCDFDYVDMGVVIIGDSNTVTHCSMTNFKNLKSTPWNGIADDPTSYEDYGANPFTIIWANGNVFTYNYISGGWAESMDFGYNGGTCETIGSCSNNKIMYNTIVDCNGLSEYGQGGTSSNNIYAYNKLVNNGAMFWVNSDCQVVNSQFYNNVIVENNNSRFALGSSNAGAGVSSSEALSHLNLDAYMFDSQGSSQTATTVFNNKNNIIQISNPLKIARTAQGKMNHDYNIVKLSGGSSYGYSLSAHETSTSGAIWVNTSDSDPSNWDFHLLTSHLGVDVSLTLDFDNKTVPTSPNTTPNIGAYEFILPSSCVGCYTTWHHIK